MVKAKEKIEEEKSFLCSDLQVIGSNTNFIVF